jgi:aspartyl-tRNA(Asn)/glutamyl-tRNA(Gln) amidotransferase subunit B
MKYSADIGLEVHAELLTRSKMFCSCSVVDTTKAIPNTSVCPVCEGLPGSLPVLNEKAVEYGLRVALALGCQIAPQSIFARKNYFYPDLPKGYQISQYEQPLAENGILVVDTSQGEKTIRIRRVHLEEDTGKLTHVVDKKESHTLVDLNRAGIPLLEIVTEPDMHSAEEAGVCTRELRSILRSVGASSGDMEKGTLRLEANISIRPEGKPELGTKVEIKNLNSFKAMEKAIDFEIRRQIAQLEGGELVAQETVGWEDIKGVTFTQRSKEEAHDYRYFPEPDLPPLVVDKEWVEQIKKSLPELPRARAFRFVKQYQLNRADTDLLAEEKSIADYFEKIIQADPSIPPKLAANWIAGELFAWMKSSGETIDQVKVKPTELAKLLDALQKGIVNLPSTKTVFGEMLKSGKSAESIIKELGLQQFSDIETIAKLVQKILAENPAELVSYKAGKTTLDQWFFGQVMRAAGGKANPQVVREELKKQLGNQEIHSDGS